jgi:hypothetical protein
MELPPTPSTPRIREEEEEEPKFGDITLDEVNKFYFPTTQSRAIRATDEYICTHIMTGKEYTEIDRSRDELFPLYSYLFGYCSIPKAYLLYDARNNTITYHPDRPAIPISVNVCLNYRFAFQSISITTIQSGHANSLFIDHKRKTVELFEPNGYFNKDIIVAIKNFIAARVEPYKLIVVGKSCPRGKGPQNIIELGICVVVSNFYIWARLFDPLYSYRSLIQEIVSASHQAITALMYKHACHEHRLVTNYELYRLSKLRILVEGYEGKIYQLLMDWPYAPLDISYLNDVRFETIGALDQRNVTKGRMGFLTLKEIYLALEKRKKELFNPSGLLQILH